jgi:death-on-curing protein
VTGVHYLSDHHLLRLAELACGGEVLVRDHGLLASAAERPAAALFGEEQYPSLLEKAAALMHSIARFQPLVDGNERLAWIAAATLCELNGACVVATNDRAVEITMAVAAGEVGDVRDIAKALEPLFDLEATFPAGP